MSEQRTQYQPQIDGTRGFGTSMTNSSPHTHTKNNSHKPIQFGNVDARSLPTYSLWGGGALDNRPGAHLQLASGVEGLQAQQVVYRPPHMRCGGNCTIIVIGRDTWLATVVTPVMVDDTFRASCDYWRCQRALFGNTCIHKSKKKIGQTTRRG